MTLTRLVLGAAMGMLFASLTVYVLTGPSPWRDTTFPSASIPTPGASASVPTGIAPPTASLPAASAGISTGSTPAASLSGLRAKASVEARPSLPSKGNRARQLERAFPPGPCWKPEPEGVFEHDLALSPALRQLPPERLWMARRTSLYGSDGCSCSPLPGQVTFCPDWCISKGFSDGRCQGAECRCLLGSVAR